MKKILSTILTLTMLTLPLAVQCSAQTYCCDNNDNCCIISESKTDNKDERSTLSKIGSFLMKTLLFTTVIVGSTAALYKWAPNGEAGTSLRNGCNQAFNYSSDLAKKAYGYSINWISNLCIPGSDKDCTVIEKKELPDGTFKVIRNCKCKDTVGTWTTQNIVGPWNEYIINPWNAFINKCIKENNGNCEMTLEDGFNNATNVWYNNFAELFKNPSPLNTNLNNTTN